MAGLGQRLLGGALAGAGQGIVHQANERRERTLALLREAGADRRQQAGFAARREESAADRAARAEEGRLGREARAEEGRLGRASAERIAGTRAQATTDAAASRAAAAREKWLNSPRKVGETLSPDGSAGYVFKTNREILDDMAQGKIDGARNALRDEIAATAEDQSSVFNWFSSKDNATDADIEKAFKLREQNPELTAAEALDRAMGGRFTGGGTAPAPDAGARAADGGSVAQLPGQGTMEAPYKASTQADIDLFKRSAPKGAYLELPDGKTVRKP